MKVKFLGMLAIFGVSLFTTSCSKEEENEQFEIIDIPVKSISLSTTAFTIEKGTSTKIRAELEPFNATNTSITWRSSDENIVQIEQNSDDIMELKIKALNIGEATITATTANGLQAECRVSVKISVESITLLSSDILMQVGDTYKLEVKVEPEGAESKIDWNISDPRYITLSEDGLVTATNVGRTRIDLKSEGIAGTQSCIISVISGGEYVDLGRGTKWATCNLGATKPNELGDKYAWGEVIPKEEGSSENYKWYDAHYTRYCVHEGGDGLTELLAEDDAATVNKGRNWRTPTSKELEDLLTHHSWLYLKSHNGFMVFNQNEDEAIFIPYECNFWSSSLNLEEIESGVGAHNCRYAECVYELQHWEGSTYFSKLKWTYCKNRATVMNIRPVFDTSPSNNGITTNLTIDNIRYTTADIKIESNAIKYIEGYTLGVLISESEEPSLDNGDLAKTKLFSNESENNNTFDATIENLKPNTIYYCRPYIKTYPGGNEYLGDIVKFSTKEVLITEGEYVDLGLSVYWANLNIGATSVEDPGEFYAWATIEPDAAYEYPGTNEISGTIYDVAHMKWGGDWRMPTYAEIDELCNNCKKDKAIYKGNPGYIYEGSNGNTIFLPAHKIWITDSTYDVYYWSSTYNTTISWMVNGVFYLQRDNVWATHPSAAGIDTKYTIRAVKSK